MTTLEKSKFEPGATIVTGITLESSHASLPRYDKALSTRKNCLISIWVSGILAIICLGASGYLLSRQTTFSGDETQAATVTFNFPFIAARVLPLFVNIIISTCTDALSYVHATTLRWALIQEGRLAFNSNLRLFTVCHKTWVNGKLVNFLSGVLIVICYTASGQMFPGVINEGDVSVNGIALLMLGVGLSGLCIISISCLTTGKKYILTWSPNPLNAALACMHHGTLVHRPGRSMMPVDSASMPAQPALPLTKQQPVRKSYKAVRTVTKFLWFLFVLTLVFAGLICGLTFVLNRVSTLYFFTRNNNVVYLPIGGPSFSASGLLFCGFLFGFAMQTFITVDLHIMELLINLSRDEASWRAASTPAGATLSSPGLSSALHSWHWWTLFLVKPFASWLFGGAGINYTFTGTVALQFNALPLFVLSAVALFLAVLGEMLSRYKPSGPQPAAFGHLQTLVDLVDDWGTEGRLFWVQRGE